MSDNDKPPYEPVKQSLWAIKKYIESRKGAVNSKVVVTISDLAKSGLDELAARSEAEDAHPVTGSSNLETVVKQFIEDNHIADVHGIEGIEYVLDCRSDKCSELLQKLCEIVGYHKGTSNDS